MRRKIVAAYAAMIVLSVVILAYGFEVFLAYSQHARVKKHCRQFGITEDRATVAARMGIKTSVNGRWYEALGAPVPKNFPLGTYPNSKIIGFKEGDGQDWPVHPTDRFGYFNEESWWNSPEMIIVGDSYVTCEHLQTNSITLAFRRRGIKAVNVGLTGAGPLLSLGALKTQWPYVSNSVRVIVWTVYDGNDYQDAMEEMRTPGYSVLLEPGYRHNPDPSLLDKLPNRDDSLFGLGYAIRSIATLKRSKLVYRAWTGLEPGADIWNQCLTEASKLCPRIILVRIPRIGFSQEKAWNKLKAPKKVEVPADPTLFSNGWVLSHLNHKGYELLVDTVDTVLK